MAKYKSQYTGAQIDEAVGFGYNPDSAPTENSEKGVKSGGIWSSIQSVLALIPTALSQLSDDATHRLTTDTEKGTWNGKQDALPFMTTPTAQNPVATQSDLPETSETLYCQAKNDGTFINKGFSINTSVPNTIVVPAYVTRIRVFVMAQCSGNLGTSSTVSLNGNVILTAFHNDNYSWTEARSTDIGIFNVAQGDVLYLTSGASQNGVMIVEALPV